MSPHKKIWPIHHLVFDTCCWIKPTAYHRYYDRSMISRRKNTSCIERSVLGSMLWKCIAHLDLTKYGRFFFIWSFYSDMLLVVTFWLGFVKSISSVSFCFHFHFPLHALFFGIIWKFSLWKTVTCYNIKGLYAIYVARFWYYLFQSFIIFPVYPP